MPQSIDYISNSVIESNQFTPCLIFESLRFFFVCLFFFFFFLSVSFFLSVFYAYQFDSSLCMDLECNSTLFSRYCFITINLLRILLYCNDKNATIKCTNLLQLGEELFKQYASVPILFTFV